MCTKSPSVAYYNNKIRTTKKSQLLIEWADAPLTEKEKSFLLDVLEKLPLKELSSKYYMTDSGISKFKRRIFEKLHQFDMFQIRK
jgi:hypothetical protein